MDFYQVSELFDDDLRLLAFALIEFGDVRQNPEYVYLELLEEDINKYVEPMETVSNIEYNRLQKWKENKMQYFTQTDTIFKNDDYFNLSCKAWKLSQVKQKYAKIKTNLLDFI